MMDNMGKTAVWRAKVQRLFSRAAMPCNQGGKFR